MSAKEAQQERPLKILSGMGKAGGEQLGIVPQS